MGSLWSLVFALALSEETQALIHDRMGSMTRVIASLIRRLVMSLHLPPQETQSLFTEVVAAQRACIHTVAAVDTIAEQCMYLLVRVFCNSSGTS